MMFQAVLRSSWICFLLFNMCSCFPFRKIQTGVGSGSTGGSLGSGSWSVSTGGDSGSGGTVSGFGSGTALDAGIAQMVFDLMRMTPNRPLQFHWDSDHVPSDMVAEQLVYPSSHVVRSNSGYQRARDSRTDSKYTRGTYDHIPLPGTPQDQPGTGSKWDQKSK